MRSPLVRPVASVVRAWTRAYTWGLPAEFAQRRRLEIESELWELRHDPHPDLAPTIHMVARLLGGVPDDLSWRLQQVELEDSLVLRRTFSMTVAAALIFSVLWISAGSRTEAAAGVRSRPVECARQFGPPNSTESFRLQVIHCAGAYFRR